MNIELQIKTNYRLFFFNQTIPITEQKIIGIHHSFIIDKNNHIEKELLLKYYENTELHNIVHELLDIKNVTLYI